MKIMKSVLKVVFWLLIVALLLAPLGLIYEISVRERAVYEAPSAPVIREGAIGASIEATRQDVDEYVRISGIFISREYDYIELSQRNASEIRWDVQVGDEIQVDQVLGTYNGKEIVSTMDGILMEINSYATKPYLKVQLLTGLELECNLSDKVIKQLRQRVAIARALILDPCLILADEPTGNLDPKNREMIFKLLRREHEKGRGILMITHDADTAAQADRQYTLISGKLSSGSG